MSGILQSLHGSIDAPAIIHQLLASTQSGDMHTAVYDFAANTMYALFSDALRLCLILLCFSYIGMAQATNTSNGTLVLPAYSRPFLYFNMTVLLNYQQ